MDRHHVAESGSALKVHGPYPNCEVTILNIFTGKANFNNHFCITVLQYVGKLKMEYYCLMISFHTCLREQQPQCMASFNNILLKLFTKRYLLYGVIYALKTGGHKEMSSISADQ
jgi:hypothetical protein